MIKLVDLEQQHLPLESELLEVFSTVLKKGQFILGANVKQLEEAFATFQNCQYGIGVSSGTDALTVALKALDIGPGDEVIVPSMTFIATAEAVATVGATPVLVDVEPNKWGIDPEKTAAAITPKTKAIIPVHLHGWPVPLNPFLRLAEQHGLSIIEDCAQAHGAAERSAPVGSQTIAGCFSFFPGKNLGSLGDAGMIVSNNADFVSRARGILNHGRTQKYFHDEMGYNARLDELQAAFLNVKFPHLANWNKQRRDLAGRYQECLQSLPLRLPPSADDDLTPVFHLYVVQCESAQRRDDLLAYLKEQGIQAGIHYPVPLHLQPALSPFGYKAGDFPVSEQASQTILSLPIYPGMTHEQQNEVVAKVSSFFAAVPVVA